jgi:hypothetical protein
MEQSSSLLRSLRWQTDIPLPTCFKLKNSWHLTLLKIVGFEVLAAVVMKSPIFWDITPCGLLKTNRRFGGTYRTACRLIHDGFFLVLNVDPEGGSYMFLRNVCWLATDYTALYSRRQNSQNCSVCVVRLICVMVKFYACIPIYTCLSSVPPVKFRSSTLTGSWLLPSKPFINHLPYHLTLYSLEPTALWPITVAAPSRAWNVFARSNTGMVGSNPIQGMDVVCVYSVFVLSCVGSGLASGWSPVQGVLPTV